MRLGRTADATIYGRHIAAAATAVVVVLLLLAPSAAAVGPAPGATSLRAAFVPQELLDAAAASPDQIFRVIVQGQPGTAISSLQAGVQQSMSSAPATGDAVNGAFSSILALAAELTGAQIGSLSTREGIFAITPDMPLRASVADPPVALEPPIVSGAAETGATLSASPGQWSGALNVYAYQWQRCNASAVCAEIAGETSSTYGVSADDTGSTLVVVVTATNADGTASSASAATAAVVAPAPPVQIVPPSALTAPAVSGVATAGETLSANDGAWSGLVTLSRVWQRCSADGSPCLEIAGETGPTYLLGADDVGATVRVVVTATDAFGSGLAVSAPSGVVAAAAAPPPPPLSALTAPAIAGTATAGQTLTADAGTWSEPVTLARQWQRCLPDGSACTDIGGGDNPTYVLGSSDVGSTIRIVVTAQAGSTSATALSNVTGVVAPAPSSSGKDPGGSGGANVPPVNATLPTTDSSPAARSTLRATPGTWTSDHPPLEYTYRWERCDEGGSSCVLVGSTRSYTPTDADAGSTLQVVVTATDDEGLATSATSALTDRVAPYSPSGFWSWQLGPYAAKVDQQWNAVAAADARPPAIAVVDSGVDPTLPGLDGTVVQQVSLTSLPQGTAVDGYGHGSFVAQVAAGHARGAAGAAPKASIVSLDVMNDDGMALTSDVVAAADWIYTHKDESNIRVANFSLIGSTPSSIIFDPLDRALEHLWLSGVVVVTAAGNFAVNGQASDEPFAPANDPFAITVGASDTAGTLTPSDDFAAPWSAYGHTIDGFEKPELGAPGRYVVASVPTASTLYTTRADRILAPGKLQLSGTSFAAPFVSGAAANLLALHPGWTPDQVKGALMLSAVQPGAATGFALGVGEIDAAAALAVTDPPNPNAAIEQFVAPDPNGGATPVFDAASWGTTAQADASWGTASWGTASWGTASWGTASWGTTYWSSASWGTASWGTASWGTASWGTASWGTASWGTASWGTDNANADVLPGLGYAMRWTP